MNVIPLKQNLSFTQYQLVVKTLEDLGIEVETEYDPYEVTDEDIRCIALAKEEYQRGEFITGEDFMKQLEAKYESNLDK